MLARKRNRALMLLVVLAGAVILGFTAAPVQAAAKGGKLIFILDASGSMWGKVEAKAKIDVAKEVMTGLIRDLPPGVEMGLVTYGQRSKGDCNDVEELMPLGPTDKEALIKKVNAVNPKGMTPITLAVKMTAEKLKTEEEATTILLVSDGEETCKGDPCAMVKELKDSGVKFVMHVIGFDVKEKEKAQLECIARAGGGRYFAAGNTKDFKMASQKVAESVSVGEEPGKLVLEKKVYRPLEKVVVAFTARPDYAETAWVGLFKSEAAHAKAGESDQLDLAYQYLGGKPEGTLQFRAPYDIGSFDFRMFDSTDAKAEEAASITFSVKGEVAKGGLTLDKNAYLPGELIRVRFKGSPT